MNPKVFIPAEHIEEVMEMSNNVFNDKEELDFLKSCLYYLKEGMNAQQAVELAMVDYLVDM